MKRLQIIMLGVGIFAITGFGISEWENVIHKAVAAHVVENVQRAWNRSIGSQWDALCHSPI
jgi:hypothetical protein